MPRWSESTFVSATRGSRTCWRAPRQRCIHCHHGQCIHSRMRRPSRAVRTLESRRYRPWATSLCDPLTGVESLSPAYTGSGGPVDVNHSMRWWIVLCVTLISNCTCLRLVLNQKNLNREQPSTECNFRVGEDCASLVGEYAVAILSQILLVLSIAAVSDTIKTVARTGNNNTPANLLQQIRCDRFRSEHIERNHSCLAPLTRCSCPLRLHRDCSTVSTISYG